MPARPSKELESFPNPRPGRHYEMLFSNASRGGDSGIGTADEISNLGFVAGLSFDKVTEQAGAQGIRLYTIRARGLELGGSLVTRSAYERPNQIPVRDSGARDAEETMVSLALETGGASFRGGTESSAMRRVLDRIRSDLACFYLLSFYPVGLPVLRLGRPESFDQVLEAAVTAEAERALRGYAWPGNVRELQNCIKRACLLASDSQIDVAALGLEPGGAMPNEPDESAVREALDGSNGVVAKAARTLGISRQALYRRMQKYGIEQAERR